MSTWNGELSGQEEEKEVIYTVRHMYSTCFVETGWRRSINEKLSAFNNLWAPQVRHHEASERTPKAGDPRQSGSPCSPRGRGLWDSRELQLAAPLRAWEHGRQHRDLGARGPTVSACGHREWWETRMWADERFSASLGFCVGFQVD